jgi:serine/threonine-protein kinase
MARKGRFSRDEVIRLLTPVAETLDEIHSQQYVHGAVTPEHIVFAGGGVPLLAGLAHARRRGQTPDKADPRYSAPELAEGQPVGPWCDTYSLGVIAYEMLTGESPFSAKSPEEWQRARAAQAPDIPAATKRLLGGDATRALLRALAKEPGDRFHSVTAFVEALKEEEPTSLRLRRVFTDLGQGARTAGKRAPRFAKVMLLALVILAGAAGVAYSGARRSEAPPEDPRTATAAFVAALQTPDTIWTPRPLHSPSPSATFDPAAATVEAGTTRVVVTATAATATTPTSTPSVPTATPPPVRPDTLHPAPTLVEPADVTRFPADGAVDLIWEYGRALEPGESFDIRMWKNGEPAWGIARSTSTRYRLSGPPKGVGEYNWLIVVVRDDPETGQPVETSGRSATRRVSWG